MQTHCFIFVIYSTHSGSHLQGRVTVLNPTVSVPHRCCHSCTPSTRCSSRATTCWMRSTRTWRNWLLRWAEHLHHRSAPLCHFPMQASWFQSVCSSFELSTRGSYVMDGFFIWFCVLYQIKASSPHAVEENSSNQYYICAHVIHVFVTAGRLQENRCFITTHWPNMSLEAQPVCGNCHSQLLWITLCLPDRVCTTTYCGSGEIHRRLLLLVASLNTLKLFFLFICPCERTFSWISWWLIQRWRRGKWSINMRPFSRGWVSFCFGFWPNYQQVLKGIG